MKSKKLLILLFAVQLLFCLSLSVFAADDVNLAFRFNATAAESSDSVVQAGDTFEVKVYIPVNKGVTYVKAYLYYDPTAVVLAENPFDYTGSAFPTVEVKNPGSSEDGMSVLTVLVGNLADVTGALLGVAPAPVYNQTGLVATVKFVALTDGVTDHRNTTIELKCTGGNVTDANMSTLANSQISGETLDVCVIGADHEHVGGTATCTDKKICEICKKEYGELAEHVFAETLSHSETEHWYACTNPACTEVKDKVAHDFGTKYTVAEGGHTQSCACGYVTPVEVHSGGTATCQVLANCEKCGTAYGELKKEHAWSETFASDETNHWHTCTVEGCTATSDKVAHKGGTATCTKQAVCEDCGKSYGKTAEHTPTEQKFDDKNHWFKCANCDYTAEAQPHVFGEATQENVVEATCTQEGSYDEVKKCACGYESREAKTIEMLEHTWEAATCTEAEKCSVCGEPGQPAKGHTPGEKVTENVKAPTCTAEGSHDEVVYCTVEDCKAEISRETVTDAKLPHDWKDATCTAPKTCKNCPATEGEKLDHEFGDWEVTKQPTTKEEGEETHKCANCGEIETRPVEKLPTDYTWLIIAVILVLAAAGIVVVVVLKKKRK